MTTKYLITSALPYINGIKHLGNLIGSILPADAYARFLRQQGKEVLYICATDDHGTPAELGAKEAGLSTEDFCNQKYQVQKNIYERFDINFDHFGRTSRQPNVELTQEFGIKLVENGFAEVRTITQLYSHVDQRFLPDRYVTGTCPHCGYESARGDQCENCTKVLDPTDLIDPKSSISGSFDLEERETNHLFLLQSKLDTQLREWIDSNTSWPNLVKSIAYKWLDEGLQDRCITRDLAWGVPVKGVQGLEGKVYYVWFDAPIGYIGATKEWADLDPNNRDWKAWWYDAEDVILTQFLAKDNIPFHTISFPATLLATQEPWKKVDFIKGFNWLNYYGGKFSTSQKRGVFTDVALELFPSDYWRYYLLARAPESSDSSFRWEDFQTVINKDLADVLGNLVNRVTKFSAKKFGSYVPEQSVWSESEEELLKSLEALLGEYVTSFENKEFRKTIFSLRQIWALGNEYVAKSEPWTVYKDSPERAATILGISINLIRIIAIISRPIIPQTSKSLLDALCLDNNESDLQWVTKEDLKEELSKLGCKDSFLVPDVLFQKIEDTQVEELEKRFGSE